MFTAKRLTAPTFATAIAVAFAGCASAPPENPRLSQIEANLRAAYNDKYTAEYGQGDLAKAEIALTEARSADRKGHDNETQHDLTMAEGYITLGGIHGGQERAKSETVALRERQSQIQIAARDRDVQRANDRSDLSRAEAATAAMAANDANNRADAARADTATAAIAVNDANSRADAARVDTANAQAATQAAQDKTAAMRTQLNMYDLKINELGATLVLRDVNFDTNSTVLRAGSINRLDPLIAFLRSSPATTVRIEGHTDNTGSVEGNNVLSLGRANAVKEALLASGSVSNSIVTYGEGQSEPVATNATVSGREQNRRVEVTLQ